MKQRTPPIVFQGVQSGDPSQDVDCSFFRRHPGATEYTRDLIPGESPEPMPPGTKVVVKRIGLAGRARAFVTPQEGLN